MEFQDVINGDSVLFSVPEEHDVHDDMRLDIDNMSYEVIDTFRQCMFRILAVFCY